MIINVENLSKEYFRNGKSFLAVNNVTFNINSGDYIGITGESGSGKSTLFNMMGGILEPSNGKIIIDGENMHNLSFNKKSDLRNSKISYILQGQNLFNNFNVLDNACMPYYLSNSKDNINIREKAEEILDQVGLIDMKNSFPYELSGGEMRRVAIARAIINNPSLIIADEPTDSLDRDNGEEVMKIFSKISNKGTAVLVSTHDLYFRKYIKTLYKMEKGFMERAL